jgi:RNA polymerase sigma-70 factor (ECF subfamily)
MIAAGEDHSLLKHPNKWACGASNGKSRGEICGSSRTGDPKALRALYDEVHPRIYRLLVRLGVHDATELTQQVILTAYRQLDEFFTNTSFKTWLYKLAVDQAKQALRAGPGMHCPKAVDQQPSAAPLKRGEQLEQALARLDPESRATYVSRDVEGLAYREIAEALGIPQGTVGSRLNRARKELRKQLTDLGWRPDP